MVANVKYAYDNGFQLASHTWAHEHLTTLTAEEGENGFPVKNFPLDDK